MRQFDVYPNPVTRAQKAFPFVAVVQSDLADTGRDRIVAFLAPLAAVPTVAGRLMPVVSIGDDAFVLFLPSLTNLPANDLVDARGSIRAERDRIVEGLDWLFLGV